MLKALRLSVSLTKEYRELVIKHQISPSHALRIGINIILAERGELDYDKNLNLYQKMRSFQHQLEIISQNLGGNTNVAIQERTKDREQRELPGGITEIKRPISHVP